MTRVLSFTAAFIALAAAACAVAMPATGREVTAHRPASASALAEAALDEHAIPALGAAYVEDGALIWVGRWGADEDALFSVASLAKPVAAEAILRLAARGGSSASLSHWRAA